MNNKIHNNCNGCGLCSIVDEGIQMKWDKGFLYPQLSVAGGTECKCPLDTEVPFNEAIASYVAHHKLLERRMDGSAGGVYGAILETIAKQDAYFTGTVYDDELHVHHQITNDPEKIKSFSGYKPTQSDSYLIFPKIKELLENGETVLFGGLPCQCHALRNFLWRDYSNLYIVDFICDGIKTKELIDLYIKKIQEENHSEVVDIRYFNKEFACRDSKRITLSNGRIIYTDTTENFDTLFYNGAFTREDCCRCIYTNIGKRIGDITIGAFDSKKDSKATFGNSYLSVNTEKGKDLFKRAKKRLEIIEEGEINVNSILNAHPPKVKQTINDLCGKSIDEIYEALYPLSTLQKYKKKLGNVVNTYLMLKKISRLRPQPLCQFIKYNFFSKRVVRNNGFIYFAPHCELLLDKDIRIELNASLVIGLRRIPTSSLETRLRMSKGSKMIIHKTSCIGNGSNVEIYKDAKLEIGELLSNSPMVIICGEYIKMGIPVNAARGCTIRDTNGHLVVMPGYKVTRPVELGNHTWICSDSTIMPGVKVGDGSIVGACSFVTQSVPNHTLVQGSPAKVLGTPEYFVM